MNHQTFRAPNGETITALDEVQASAFINAGLEPVEAKPKRTTKSSE